MQKLDDAEDRLMGKYTFSVLTVMAILGMILLCTQTGMAQDKAHKVKAVFLFKFFDYVTWPSGQPGVSSDGLLCTYGAHGFGDTLDYIAKHKKDKHSFLVRAIDSIEESKPCHILYMSERKYGEIPLLPEGSGVLIVGDDSRLLDEGGAISIQENNGKIGLVVNLPNAKKQKLHISSRLLSIARVQK